VAGEELKSFFDYLRERFEGQDDALMVVRLMEVLSAEVQLS
jgi:hypothetical protein